MTRRATSAKPPAALGFRMPAEWEPHEATWIAWPHNLSDWPGKFAPVLWVYTEIVKRISPGELVRILVNSEEQEAKARRVLARAGVDLAQVEFFRFPTNRSWTRDFGPIFVRPSAAGDRGSGFGTRGSRTPNADLRFANTEPRIPNPVICRFRFNAWAKYPNWRLDDAVPERAARALGCRLFRARAGGRDLVLEGGSIDVNGQGALLTTEECLLDTKVQARNPGLGREEIEAALGDYLGATQVLWLAKGIAGDDTHGHIDDLCRFVGPRTVVLCQEDNPNDFNYRVLRENRERLEGMRLADGSRLEVLPLPLPSPLVFDGQRLPASYANFYIANAAVLVPTFNDPKDRVALGILAELIRDRPVIGIHAVDLVWGLGTIHCLTQQQPRAPSPIESKIEIRPTDQKQFIQR